MEESTRSKCAIVYFIVVLCSSITLKEKLQTRILLKLGDDWYLAEHLFLFIVNYSQTSWGRLQMKSNRVKEVKRGISNSSNRKRGLIA